MKGFCWVSACCTGHNNRDRRLKISMFRFPPEEEKLKEWMAVCRIPEMYEKLHKEIRICSRHFEEKCVALTQGGRFRLTKDAFPTLFRWNGFISPNGTPAFDPKRPIEHRSFAKPEKKSSRRVPAIPEVVASKDVQGEEAIRSQPVSALQEGPVLKKLPKEPLSATKKIMPDEQPNAGPEPHVIVEGQSPVKEATKRKPDTPVDDEAEDQPLSKEARKSAECLGVTEDRTALKETVKRPASVKRIMLPHVKRHRILRQKYRRAVKKMVAMQEELDRLRDRDKSWSEVLEEHFHPVFGKLLRRVVIDKKQYSDEEKKLCIDLHGTTIKGYEWVRKFLPLPHKRTIRKWLAPKTNEAEVKTSKLKAKKSDMKPSRKQNMMKGAPSKFDADVEEPFERNKGEVEVMTVDLTDEKGELLVADKMTPVENYQNEEEPPSTVSLSTRDGLLLEDSLGLERQFVACLETFAVSS